MKKETGLPGVRASLSILKWLGKTQLPIADRRFKIFRPEMQREAGDKNAHLSGGELEEAARRRVEERLHELDKDRDYFDAVRRMAEENDRLRHLPFEHSHASMSLSVGSKASCPKCNGTGKRECATCDGRGEYFGRRGMTLCTDCSGTGRVRCNH